MGGHFTDEQCSEVAQTCITYLMDKSTQDRELFKTTPNMTSSQYLFKGLARGDISRIKEEGGIDNYVHIVLGTLQIAFREMRYSIFHDIYSDITAIESLNVEDVSVHRAQVARLIRKLPPKRFNLVKNLCALLFKTHALACANSRTPSYSSKSAFFVQDSSLESIMVDNNPNGGYFYLSTIIAPYVCRLPEHESAFMSIRHNRDLHAIRPFIEFLIEHYAEIFRGLTSNPVPLVIPSVSVTGSDSRNGSRPTSAPSRSPSSKGGYNNVSGVTSASGDTDMLTSRSVDFSSDSDAKSSGNGSSFPSVPPLHIPIPGSMDSNATNAMNVDGVTSVDHGAITGANPNPPLINLHNVNFNSWEWKTFESLVSFTVQSYLSNQGSLSHSSSGLGNATLSPCPSFSYSVMRKASISSDDDFDYISEITSSNIPGGAAGVSSQKPTSSKEQAYVRRHMVMECRKLRSQIYKFEEDFANTHNRVPKGAERGPMQGVYTKYRGMKKEIRHLASVEIQRLWRGFISRHRSKQDRVSSFVSSTNAMSVSGNMSTGTSGDGGGSSSAGTSSGVTGRASTSGGNDMVLKDLEEDSAAMDVSSSGGSRSGVVGSSGSSGIGSVMDVVSSTTGSGCSSGAENSVLPPQPSMSDSGALAISAAGVDVLSLSTTVDTSSLYQQGRGTVGLAPPGNNFGARPLTPAVSAAGTSAALLSSTAVNSNAGAVGATSGAGDSAQVMYARYKELLTEKRELKRLLKKFDEEFAHKNGRLPLKPEKEIMRPKYQKYHEIKHDMEVMRIAIELKHGPMPSDDEQEGSGSSGGGRDSSRERSLSLNESTDRLFADVGDESGSSKGGAGNRRSSKERSSSAGPPVTTSASINALLMTPPTRSNVVVGTAVSALSPEALASLQDEKKQLHLYLKSYEKEFTKANGRPVIKHEDILPVSVQYQRYKELKMMLKDV